MFAFGLPGATEMLAILVAVLLVWAVVRLPQLVANMTDVNRMDDRQLAQLLIVLVVFSFLVTYLLVRA